MKIKNFEGLKERIQIMEVLENHIDLYKIGANFKAFCPFHEERTASFIVSPEKNIFKCFGCGVSGDALKFLPKTNALKPLAFSYGDTRRNAFRRANME